MNNHISYIMVRRMSHEDLDLNYNPWHRQICAMDLFVSWIDSIIYYVRTSGFKARDWTYFGSYRLILASRCF